ncbi:MAG: PDZ domain-containing protein [Pyrinomonadaceae bacterium]|nr:PDZ domain-containing protein [Pyrinomonadaceae bacterium]MCX7640333.1 PDZ domain-containing protein [Pyrinomonadaceae bacterium]MDW8304760.1 PDZ domain-containing protein [Acidobacteriota bacterium]
MRRKLILILFAVLALSYQLFAQQATVELYAFGSESYLGVRLQEITENNYKDYKLSSVQGVAIEKVFEGSPAAQAGLQAGDVIVQFNGEQVTSVRKLIRLISEVAPDHQVRIKLLRDGKEREVNVKMGRRSKPDFRSIRLQKLPENLQKLYEDLEKRFPEAGDNFFILRTSNRRIGIETMSLTKQLGDYFGVPDGNGLLIINVIADSPAAKAGLKAGDVIIEVDGKAIRNVFELSKIINSKKEGSVTLTIVRDKMRQSVVLTPETIKNESFFDLDVGKGQIVF